MHALTFADRRGSSTEEVLVAGNTAGSWGHRRMGRVAAHLLRRAGHDGNGHVYTNQPKQGLGAVGDIKIRRERRQPIGYATVRDCPSPRHRPRHADRDRRSKLSASTLSATKAVRGQIVKHTSCTDSQNAAYGSMYGITAWGTKSRGFSAAAAGE
jgi:hypothetical protein